MEKSKTEHRTRNNTKQHRALTRRNNTKHTAWNNMKEREGMKQQYRTLSMEQHGGMGESEQQGR